MIGRAGGLGVPRGCGFARDRGAGKGLFALRTGWGVACWGSRHLVCRCGGANIPMKSGCAKGCKAGIQRRWVLDDKDQPKP